MQRFIQIKQSRNFNDNLEKCVNSMHSGMQIVIFIELPKYVQFGLNTDEDDLLELTELNTAISFEALIYDQRWWGWRHNKRADDKK